VTAAERAELRARIDQARRELELDLVDGVWRRRLGGRRTVYLTDPSSRGEPLSRCTFAGVTVNLALTDRGHVDGVDW
jgi:hypothetical protein